MKSSTTEEIVYVAKNKLQNCRDLTLVVRTQKHVHKGGRGDYSHHDHA